MPSQEALSLKEISTQLKRMNDNFAIFAKDYKKVHEQELKEMESKNESNEFSKENC